MSERYGVPPATGAWHLAMEHLRQAYILMENMKVDSHHGVDSLGNVFRRQIEAMIGTIDHHWQREYMKVATQPATVVIPLDEVAELSGENRTIESVLPRCPRHGVTLDDGHCEICRDEYEEATWD